MQPQPQPQPKPIFIAPEHQAIVFNALAARPWGEVNNVMVSLMQQVQQSDTPVEPKPAAADKPKADKAA